MLLIVCLFEWLVGFLVFCFVLFILSQRLRILKKEKQQLMIEIQVILDYKPKGNTCFLQKLKNRH